MVVEGVTLLVEIAPTGGSENTSRLDSAREAVTGAFDRAQTAIVAVATSTVSTIGQLDQRSLSPSEVEVKFGLKFAAEGSVILAGASGEATLEVTLKYAQAARFLNGSRGPAHAD
jgi:hypothetical protein